MKTFKRTCNKLNKILKNRPDSRDELISTINKIIYNELIQQGGSLHWSRELFINCGNDELCRKAIHTDKVMFVPSDDPVEHPGITLTYKPEFSVKSTTYLSRTHI